MMSGLARKIVSFGYLWIVPLTIVFAFTLVDILCQWSLPKISVGGWCYIVREAVCCTLFIGGCALLLGRCFRWIFPVVIGMLLFFSSANLVSRSKFGMNLFGDMVMIALGSTWAEVRDFFCGIFVDVYVCSALLFVLCLYVLLVVYGCKKMPRATSRGTKVFALLLFVPALCVHDFRMANCLSSMNTYRVLREIGKVSSFYRNMSTAASHPQLPVIRDKVPPQIGVFVIGESSTRNNWSLYGYERTTTPQLDAMRKELFVFDDLLAPWSHTHMALRYIFSDCDLDGNEEAHVFLPQICTNAGYRVVFVSAQAHMGGVDVSGQYIFSACQKRMYLSDINADNHIYDSDVLPVLKDVLSKRGSNEPILVFLHLYGSHYRYENRIPAQRRLFSSCSSPTVMDYYDDTIVETDITVAGVIKILKDLGGRTFMLYLSDHGETPRANGWRSYESRDLWEVPMIAWYSDAYKMECPDLMERVARSTSRRLQADQLTVGLAEMMGIAVSTPNACNFLDGDAKLRTKRNYKNNSAVYDEE